jgi:DNA ligase-4
LFNPLTENWTQPGGAQARRTKVGPHGKLTPAEQRRAIIERFISQWRSEVGDDFYPALRLIIPQSDRDRGVYGMKESNIVKLLIKLLGIKKDSPDGQNLNNWKIPIKSTTSTAGDFAGRCFEVLEKRTIGKGDVGDMRVADVNELLDKLSGASGESEQLPIFQTFYQRMNAEELMWLIRIILKQMKVGATERTFFDVWHPDAEALFSVSTSLRRVCWELYDRSVRLDAGETGLTLMQIFQPQLAQFQFSTSFKKMVDKLTLRNRPEEGEIDYWIEEKLDGERMQMHMMEDDNVPGGAIFGFWSRKAKNYAYLYGESFQDESSALTRHLKEAFAPGVRNIILDGEMITWDMKEDKVMPFGTLKTAALAGKRNPYDEIGARPLYRVFDIVYLNDQDLTRYTLQDRRNALEKAVKGTHRRLELHNHTVAKSPDDIEPLLRKIIDDKLEGLVLKNPRSMYSLNQRNDDWIKVKPDYMDEYGEAVDVVVVGAYYGSGYRGGGHSSFLCGLRVTQNDIDAGADPEKCYSFVKVGGGFNRQNYKEINHETEGKWQVWDPKNPPSKYIELAGGDRQFERPDEWIRPSESVVISVKAASAGDSQSFAKGWTLRFPRFKALRLDRSWDSALNWKEFLDYMKRAEEKMKEKAMNMDTKRRPTKRLKKDIVIAGQEAAPAQFGGPTTKVFAGLEFCVLTESVQPKKSKTQLETIIKENGGTVVQRAVAETDMLLIGDKKVVKVASLIKAGGAEIISPKWILDCVAHGDQNFLLPFEPSHLFHAPDMQELAETNVDKFGDSYARNVDVKELKNLLQNMPKNEFVDKPANTERFLSHLQESGLDLGTLKGHIFSRICIYFAIADGSSPMAALKLENRVRFGGGRVIEDLASEAITHVVVLGKDEREVSEVAAEMRSTISSRQTEPRVVSQQWLEDCWIENTLVNEEKYAPK